MRVHNYFDTAKQNDEQFFGQTTNVVLTCVVMVVLSMFRASNTPKYFGIKLYDVWKNCCRLCIY